MNLDVNTIAECDRLSDTFAFGLAVAKFAETLWSILKA